MEVLYKALFLDTETSDKVNVRTPYDNLDDWPHVLSVTAILREVFASDKGVKLGKVLGSLNKYIKYEGPINPDASEVNGITTEFLRKNGDSVLNVMTEFVSLFNQADFCVAHNTVFDMKMLKAEMLRLIQQGHTEFEFHMRSKPWVDTMYHGTKICNIKTSKGRLKYPRLVELYQTVVPNSVADSVSFHNSSTDVDILMQCFESMSNSNLFSLNHFKNIFAKLFESK